MGLSNDLIMQFAKITKAPDKTRTETTVYGTMVEHGGSSYVQLDGSDLLTPVTTTVDAKVGDRVTVLLKNHTATVTGNITSPAARTETVNVIVENVSEIDKVLADVVLTEQLDASNARITKLEAADVTITGKITANTADIETLESKNATITGQLTAIEANVGTLTANDVTITNRLTAAEASIQDIKVGSMDADTIKATYATIANLDATNARVDVLEGDVADVNTLIFGSASGETIHTSFANAVIAQLGDAQIKSAMIESVSAGKITAGDIITNNVRVKSEDGSLLISDETMQISDGTRVRVQIGKDAANDYSINIWDQNGNLMFSKGGITDNAIKEAIIRNDMVSDTANIAAHKLDIDSLFEEINGSTNTIKSTQIYLDDEKQTLDVAFKELSTTVTEQGETVSSQGTAISTIQGQISSKIWQQDINTATNEMSTQYSALEQEVDGFKSTVSETYATKTSVDNIKIGGRNLMVNSEEGYAFTGKSFSNSTHTGTMITCTVDGGKADHYCMVTDFVAPTPTELSKEVGTEITFSADVKIVGTITNPHMTFDLRNAEFHMKNLMIRAYADPSITDKWQRISGTAVISATDQNIDRALIAMLYDSATIDSTMEYRRVKVERGNKATDWTPAPEDLDANVDDLGERVLAAETTIIQHTEAITASATKTEVSTAKAEAISTASADATAKANDALVNANSNTNNLLKNYSTTAEMNAAIQLKADSITSSVNSTYATISSLNTTKADVTLALNAANNAQADIDNLEIGGRNYAILSNLKRYHGGALYAPLSYWTVEGTKIVAVDQPTSGPMPGFKIDITGGYAYVVSGFTDLPTFKMYSKCFDADGNEVEAQTLRYRNPVNGAFEIQFTVPETTSYIHLGTGSDTVSDYYVDLLKIECGTRATDWTPAPEDIDAEIMNLDARVSSAESSITQLSDKITANVTETTNLGTRMSTVEQTASGLSTRLTTAETDIDTAQSTANTAKTNAATAQTTANNAAKTATNYLGFSNSGLVVGDMTASTLGKNVLIDSDSVDIRNGSTVMASFGANTVTLGRNAEDSVIDLCDGAGKISANTAEAATSYPNRNAILIESQEIETESVRFVASTSNKYGATTTPTVQRGTELYMTRSGGSAESCARLKAEHKTVSSGAYTNSGVSAMTYDAAASTRLLIYASDSANSTYNNVNVYPTKTTMNKNLVLNGTTFTGKNKVLWSGVYYMSDSQTATLSEAISAQANGIVLIWSYYTDGAADNSNFQMTFIPKHFITLHPGKGVASVLTNGTMNIVASKYVYISDTSIKGYAGNDDAATEKTSGITSTAKNFVLRYVIGV